MSNIDNKTVEYIAERIGRIARENQGDLYIEVYPMFVENGRICPHIYFQSSMFPLEHHTGKITVKIIE